MSNRKTTFSVLAATGTNSHLDFQYDVPQSAAVGSYRAQLTYSGTVGGTA